MGRNAGTLYALGAIGLGATGLAFGDFARQWQPVPADVPARLLLAHASAVLLAAAGLSILLRRYAVPGAWTLSAFYAAWVVVLHAPIMLATPFDILPWLGLAEILALACAGGMLALSVGGRDRLRLRRAIRIVFGACPLVFGMSHFAYPEFTAGMVPAWMPWRTFWAYATGFGHVAAGAAIMTGMVARPASTALAAMMGSFVVLVHVPRVVGNPGSHHEWTMLFMATSLTGAAWNIADSFRRKPAHEQ